MKLFGFNVRITRSERREMVSLEQRGAAVGIEQWIRGEDLDGLLLGNAYQQVVWVYRAVNALAEQVANVPFRFSTGETGAEELVTAGPVPEFYARPHPQISGFQYWELRVMWLMLRGECFRVPVFESSPSPHHSSTRAKLKNVLLLDPAYFQQVVEGGQLLGWRYTGLGPQAPLASQVFLPEEVWFEKLPNPFDFWRGMSPLQVAAMAAQTDFAASAFMKGIIENNGDQGLIVRSDKALGDEQKNQILAALRERKRRAGIADRPLVIENTTEIIKPGLSSSDLQFLENRKFSRGEICAAFGVPEEIVSATDHAKYDVMEGARRNFIENRVVPLCARLQAEENATTIPALLPPSARHPSAVSLTGWFDTDSLPIMQQARRDRLAAAKTGFDMGIPLNELNRVLDLGFKRLPWGDTGFVPAKYQPLGTEPHALSIPVSVRPRSLVPEPRGDFKVQISDFITGKLSRFLFEQRARALAKLAQASDPESGAAGAKPGPLFDLCAEEAELWRLLGSLLPPEQPQRGEAFAPYSELNRRVLEALDRAVAEGRAAGGSVAQLSTRVRDIYNHFSRGPAL